MLASAFREFVFLTCLSLGVSSICFASVSRTYVTSKGAVFTEVDFGRFGKAWEAPDGTIWSSVQGSFSNVGTHDATTVLDSPAVQACEQLGGRLPSRQDFENLRTYFETAPTLNPFARKAVYLTRAGKKDFRALFPLPKGADTHSVLIWSSTLTEHFGSDRRIYCLNGYGGATIRAVWGEPASVRCIGRSARPSSPGGAQ